MVNNRGEPPGRLRLPVGTSLVKPVGVEGPVSAGEGEADATRCVVGVHDRDGGRDLRIRDVSTSKGSALVDHMPFETNGRQLRYDQTKTKQNLAYSGRGWVR